MPAQTRLDCYMLAIVDIIAASDKARFPKAACGVSIQVKATRLFALPSSRQMTQHKPSMGLSCYDPFPWSRTMRNDPGT